uniref:ADF-H domain-containing protein n=1 Tax=Panagrolaimus sp. PS1159 TaxID=55785 RepID=A0AC35G0X6_9BILA
MTNVFSILSPSSSSRKKEKQMMIDSLKEQQEKVANQKQTINQLTEKNRELETKVAQLQETLHAQVKQIEEEKAKMNKLQEVYEQEKAVREQTIKQLTDKMVKIQQILEQEKSDLQAQMKKLEEENAKIVAENNQFIFCLKNAFKNLWIYIVLTFNFWFVTAQLNEVHPEAAPQHVAEAAVPLEATLQPLKEQEAVVENVYIVYSKPCLIPFNDDCSKAFKKLLDNNDPTSSIIYKNDGKEITVEVVRCVKNDIDHYEDNSKQSYEYFFNDLKDRTNGLIECRYGIIDMKFMCKRYGNVSTKMNKVIFIQFCPERDKKSFFYAASAHGFKTALAKNALNKEVPKNIRDVIELQDTVDDD